MKTFKSFVVKLTGLLGTLLFGLALSAQQVTITTPGAQTVAEHKNDAGARSLISHFTAMGYRELGTIAEGTKSFQDASLANGPVVTVVALKLVKEGAASIDVTISSEKADGRIEYSAIAEDANTAYKVQSGVVITMAKAGLLSRIIECYNKFLKGNVQNCVSCYNCLVACIQDPNNNTFWKKFICSLQCNTCYSCLKSIWKFLKCVF
jgi:hypothetical protein